MPSLFIRNMEKDMERVLRHVIVEEGKKRFAIYTNGTGGKMVREYLESEFGIYPEYVIDNIVYNGRDILNIVQAKERDNREIYFLICSWNNEYYDEIRNTIYEGFPKEQVIDVFPRREKKNLPEREEICQILSIIDKDIKGLVEKNACKQYTAI